MGVLKDCGAAGFWFQTSNRILFYELNDFYKTFANLESTVCKLQRLNGLGEHPNRIMVATDDGGMRFVNVVTGLTIGIMYPITTLKIMDKYIYNAFKRRIYMILPGGSVFVLSCKKSPFRKLELMQPRTPDEEALCMCSVVLSVGHGWTQLEDMVIFIGMQNGQVTMLASESFTFLKPFQAHHGAVYCLEPLTETAPSQEQVCRTNTVLVSSGGDMMIKIWELCGHPDEEHGMELRLVKLMQLIDFGQVPEWGEL
nr:hypothetical protein BaRGS_025005 [Batillaria attramentaria]